MKRDKEVFEHENVRLKEFLQAKDLDVDARGYQQMIGSQAASHGRDTQEEMDKRSKSLGMRSS